MKNVLLIVVCLSSFIASAQVYKWTDEKGNVIYSDRPQHDDAVVYSELQGETNQSAGSGNICQRALDHEISLYQKEKPDEILTEVLQMKKAAAVYLKFCQDVIKHEGHDQTFQCILQNNTIDSVEACSTHLENNK